MNKQLSVTKAITIGRLLILTPAPIIIFSLTAYGINLFKKGIIPIWGIPLLFVFSLFIFTIYWSFSITKWRIWAFSNVRNLHELKKRAIEEKLIGEDHSFSTKCEIRSRKDKETIKQIHMRFRQKDIIQENQSIEDSIEIYPSAKVGYVELIVSGVIMSGSLYFLQYVKNLNPILAYIMFTIGLFGVLKEIHKFINFNPIIKIDKTGITVRYHKRYWKEIYDEKIIKEGFGDSSKRYLQFYSDDTIEKTCIDNLSLNYNEIETALQTYRIRYNKKHEQA